MKNKRGLTQNDVELANQLLAKLDLPEHRQEIDKSGRNVQWLRKHVGTRNEVPKELENILARAL